MFRGLNIHFEEKYGPGCFAMLDIMPTIYARHIHFYQRARPKTSGVTECLALDIFGNEPGNFFRDLEFCILNVNTMTLYKFKLT